MKATDPAMLQSSKRPTRSAQLEQRNPQGPAPPAVPGLKRPVGLPQARQAPLPIPASPASPALPASLAGQSRATPSQQPQELPGLQAHQAAAQRQVAPPPSTPQEHPVAPAVPPAPL